MKAKLMKISKEELIGVVLGQYKEIWDYKTEVESLKDENKQLLEENRELRRGE